jgi:hypothetical protein
MYLDLPSPAESPKSVFAHEHVTCAPGDERDAQDTSQGESRRERDGLTGESSWNPTPHAPGRDPVRENGGDGLP